MRVKGMVGLKDAIKDYYKRNHIEPNSYRRFECPDKELCRDGCKTLTTGNEPFIGSRYERRVRPRLLIFSAEPAGGDPQNANGRTVEGHAAWESEEKQKMKKTGLHPRSHWFKTAQTAVWVFEVIKTRKPSQWVWDAACRSEFPAVAPYWAHTNSGKCSQNLPGGHTASAVLFENCKKYIGREIRILDPDIIVTQGQRAREALEAAIEWKELEPRRSAQSYETGSCHVLIMPGHPVLWIVMPHPNAQNNVWYGLIKKRSPYSASRIISHVAALSGKHGSKEGNRG